MKKTSLILFGVAILINSTISDSHFYLRLLAALFVSIILFFSHKEKRKLKSKTFEGFDIEYFETTNLYFPKFNGKYIEDHEGYFQRYKTVEDLGHKFIVSKESLNDAIDFINSIQGKIAGTKGEIIKI